MTHMDVVCVDTLITGSTEHQVINHLREKKQRGINIHEQRPGFKMWNSLPRQ